MKNIYLFISLLIYSFAFTQQNNHPDYFEKYWTPSATGNSTFACTSLIATDSSYVGAGNLYLGGGFVKKSFAFSIDEETKWYNWDKILEDVHVTGNMYYYSLTRTFDGNYVIASRQFDLGLNDDPANFQLVITKIAPNGTIIFKKKYFDSIEKKLLYLMSRN